MVQSQLFSGGFEVAPFVTSSGLLQRSWNVITSSHAGITSTNGVGLSWKVYKEQNVTIVAFEAFFPNSSNLEIDLVSSSDLKERNLDHFKFLSTEKNPIFSLNRNAVSLFFNNIQRLDLLKSEISSSPLLIITGLALGGSIASLFTLSLLDLFTSSLLDKKDSKKKRPLCITFGSPLIGDKKLQEVISHSSILNSCFLNVVSYKDPLPRRFITNPSYMPFGTFLLCSKSNTYCTSFENPNSILELLKASIHDQNQVFHSISYGDIVKSLSDRAILKESIAHVGGINHSNSLHASISLQLQGLGWTPPHMERHITYVNYLETQETKFIQKKESIDPSKKLNMQKIDMAYLEGYKISSKNQNIGYYDSYDSNSMQQSDQDAITHKKKLTIYWKEKVEEARMKPQKEGAAMRTSFLYGGTNYRRMVEPLAIGEYYKEGAKDYINNGRSNHFKKLEEWWFAGIAEAKGTSGRKNVEALLTIDSCFWAHVEEALLSCKELNDVNSSVSVKEEAIRKLLEFENYVYGQLMNYDVSSEIFLNGSSYMRWWYQYKEIKERDYSSALASFMSNADNYNVKYVGGTYDFTAI